MNIGEEIKQLWKNPVIKGVIVAAVGGAFGAVSPMLMTGTFVLNTTTTHAAITGAITAITALFIRKPEPKP